MGECPTPRLDKDAAIEVWALIAYIGRLERTNAELREKLWRARREKAA